MKRFEIHQIVIKSELVSLRLSCFYSLFFSVFSEFSVCIALYNFVKTHYFEIKVSRFLKRWTREDYVLDDTSGRWGGEVQCKTTLWKCFAPHYMDDFKHNPFETVLQKATIKPSSKNYSDR